MFFDIIISMNKFIIFDADGTLLDTLPGITKALNETLSELNLPYKYNEEQVKGFIGGGVKRLLSLALKREFNEYELSLMLKNYAKYQYLAKTYPNVLDTLEYLKEHNIKLFVYSNKPHNLLKEVIKLNFPIDLFAEVQGDNFIYKRKPDPEYLLFLFMKYNLNPKDGYYMGDSEYDCLTSKNSNLKSIIYTKGFGDYEKIKQLKPDYMIDDFNVLKEIIK